MSKVILICGKIGSGKTTYANKLVKQLNAVNISQDELMLDLFSAELYYNEPEQYEKYCSKIENMSNAKQARWQKQMLLSCKLKFSRVLPLGGEVPAR